MWMVIQVGKVRSRKSSWDCGSHQGGDNGDLEQGRDSGNGKAYLGLRGVVVMSRKAWGLTLGGRSGVRSPGGCRGPGK